MILSSTGESHVTAAEVSGRSSRSISVHVSRATASNRGDEPAKAASAIHAMLVRRHPNRRARLMNGAPSVNAGRSERRRDPGSSTLQAPNVRRREVLRQAVATTNPAFMGHRK